MAEVSALAVFVDFENLALGFQNRHGRFDIRRVLQRLVEKGKIIVKKGYADWSRYSDYKRQLHESGLELIEIPRRAMTGKNSADIRLCVDAMDLCYSKEHIDTFVIVSGDSDFSPLVAKLKENGKRVIGLAMRKSTSDLLMNACDEFIFYEDLEGDGPEAFHDVRIPAEKQEIFRLLLDTLEALRRETTGSLYSSMIKDTMKRKMPSFGESAYGYRTFSDVLEDAQQCGLVKLQIDARSGTYVVTEFHATGRKRTRRGGRGRRGGRTRAHGEAPSPAGAAQAYENGDAVNQGRERPHELELDRDEADSVETTAREELAAVAATPPAPAPSAAANAPRAPRAPRRRRNPGPPRSGRAPRSRADA